MSHPSHSSTQNTTQFKQLSVSVELQHCDVTSHSLVESCRGCRGTCGLHCQVKIIVCGMDCTVKSKLMYVAINRDKPQYPTPIELLNPLLTVPCPQMWSVLNLLACPHPSKQAEHFPSRGAITGHSITCSVSVITNMTVREQNLEFGM